MTDKKYEYKVLSPVSVSAKNKAKDAQIGDVVKLTKTQAANRVNKVVLLSRFEKNQSSADSEAQKQHQREQLEIEVGKRALEIATEKGDEILKARIVELEDENETLKAQIVADKPDDENPIY